MATQKVSIVREELGTELEATARGWIEAQSLRNCEQTKASFYALISWSVK